VSLFEQNSLDDVGNALFESAVPIDGIAESVDSEVIATSLNCTSLDLIRTLVS
jgi:hypothetical protein